MPTADDASACDPNSPLTTPPPLQFGTKGLGHDAEIFPQPTMRGLAVKPAWPNHSRLDDWGWKQ